MTRVEAISVSLSIRRQMCCGGWRSDGQKSTHRGRLLSVLHRFTGLRFGKEYQKLLPVSWLLSLGKQSYAAYLVFLDDGRSQNN